MPKFEVSLVTTVNKYLGEFEAADKASAMRLAKDSDAYQSTGGLCHHCSRSVGDEADSEIVASEVK